MDDASCAAIGTRRRKMSGPDISGSLGLNGMPLTNAAPVKQIFVY